MKINYTVITVGKTRILTIPKSLNKNMISVRVWDGWYVDLWVKS